jgi:Bacterial Ig domain/GDSL-like Lipase/Acylhydrolase
MRIRVLPFLAVASLVALVAAPAVAQVTGGLGVLGDSSSDEYRADDNRGGAYAATTLNWLELLARHRGVNVGPWGTWGGSRRTGYEFNWARSGARAADLFAQGQAPGLAQQVTAGRVSAVVLMIGTNDFAVGNGSYAPIYDGTLTGAALAAKIDGVVASIAQAMDVLLAAGPVQLLVANLPAQDVSSQHLAMFPDPARRQLVLDAMLAVSNGIENAAVQRGVPVLDLDAFAAGLFARVDGAGNIDIGGQLVSLVVPGDEPHHALLGDGKHTGTVMGGLLANYILDQFEAAGGPIVPRFTDAELWSNAGVLPPDTVAPTVSITSPASGAMVSGSVVVAATAADDRGVAGIRFKVDGANLGTEDTNAPYSVTWNTTTLANGPHVLTATARDAAGNTTISTRTVNVVNPQVLYPASYRTISGSHQSGSVQSLAADDGNHLVIRSTTSSLERTAQVELAVNGVSGTVSRLDIRAIVNASASNTTARVYVYDVTTSAWTQLSSFTIGPSETTRNITVSASPARYVDTTGTLRLRIQSSRLVSTHSLSVEMVRVTTSP